MLMRTCRTVVTVILSAGSTAFAQGDTAGQATQSGTIVLRADVSAREVRFTRQPEIRVTLVGGTLDSVRVLERRNLPERVVPGTTYRDVYIAVEVIGKLHAECLADRLSAVGSRVRADSTVKRCDLATGAAGVTVPRSP